MGRTTEGGRNIFEAAATFGFRGVKYFVEKKGIPVDSRNVDNRTAAHLAAREGKLDVVKYLLGKNTTLVNATDSFGYTMFHLAAMSGAMNVIDYLLDECKVDLYQPNEMYNGNTPVHLTAEVGQLKIFRYFIEKRDADMNILNSLGQPPIFLAAQKKRTRIVKYMIDVQRDLIGVMARDNEGSNILFMSAKSGDTSVPKLLFTTYKLDIDVNEQDNTGATVAFWASKLGHFDFLKYIVSWKHADVNIANYDGRTPLHEAASAGHVFVAKFLIERNANKTVLDNYGFSPRDCCADEDILACFKKVGRKRTKRSFLPTLNYISPRLPPLNGGSHLAEVKSGQSLPNDKLDASFQIFVLQALTSSLIEYFIRKPSAVSVASLSPKSVVGNKIDPRAIDAIDAFSVFKIKKP